MIDWFTSLSPEAQAAFAVAALAAVSLFAQARSQARQTRLALLDRRLAVYEAYVELVRLCIEFTGLLRMGRHYDIEYSEITEASRRVLALMNNAAMLFESEIEELGHEIVDLEQEIHDDYLIARVHRHGKKAEELYRASLMMQLAMRKAFSAYISRERKAGLGWRSRFMRFWTRLQEDNDRELARSGLGPPQPPLNEHRPL